MSPSDRALRAARERAERAIRGVLERAILPGGEFILDGEWYVTAWGCDTFDHLRERIEAQIRAAEAAAYRRGAKDGQERMRELAVRAALDSRQEPIGPATRGAYDGGNWAANAIRALPIEEMEESDGE